jgi:N-acetyl-alpha-D-muramate 1-phosphate uridylyltransferase
VSLGRQEVAAVVLAAGLGTRLRPLTDLRPKALCPVGNVPLVDLNIGRMRTVVDDVAVNVHAGRTQMEAHLSAHRVHVSVEEAEPLGTAGALGRLRDWIADRPVLVTNADAWHRFDVGVLLEGWNGERSRLLVMEDRERGDFGPWRYVGSALMAWSVVRDLSDAPSGLYEVLWRRQQAEGQLELVTVEGEFHDCGTPADYLAANLAASGGSSVVAPSAIVEGTVIRSVVWPDSVVAAGERLVDRIRAGSLTV